MATSPPSPLDKPGKGLPFIEWALSRYYFLPRAIKSMTREQAIQKHQEWGNTALSLAKNLEKEALTHQVLIPRIRGIEDSSRYWSVSMTIEHLLIVGTSMTQVIQMLAHKQKPNATIKIENFKPDPATPPEKALKEYESYLNRYPEIINELGILNDKSHTQKHPWFWEMTAYEWLALNAFHTRIHLRQIQEIIKRM